MEIAKLVKDGIEIVNKMEEVIYYQIDNVINDKGIIKAQYKAGKELSLQIQSDINNLKADKALSASQASCIIYFETSMNFKPQCLANSNTNSADVILRNNETYWLLTDVIEDYSHSLDNKTGFMVCQAVLQGHKPEGIE